ncbi:MAG: ATP-binding protein [Thermodesulfobacteriota bacterium]
MSLYSIYQGRQRIFTTFEKDAREITAIISKTLVNDLYFLDVHSLRLLLRNTRVNPDISHIYVADLEGLVLADGTSENPQRDQKLTDTFSEEILHSDDWISRVENGVLKVGGPILMIDGSRVGHLQVGFSLDTANQIIRDMTRTGLYVTVICLGIGVVLAFIIATSFSRPILSIAQASREIGEGRLDTRLSIKRNDELGTLAKSVNQMAETLQTRRDEAKRAEGQIKASMVELEKALQVKSDFLGTMSHELRTPLHVIMSNVALLIDGLCGEINEEQEKRLRVIERNSGDLLGLVQGVLDITRIEEGRMSLHLEEICVGEILNEVQAEFHDLSLKRGITLEIDSNGSTPPVVSDRLKLKEILHNLISNALKFTKDGKIKVKGCHLKERDRIELLVQDSGIGIQGENLPHIFDVFYQVDSSNQREFGGTGLGLNIVKKLVELLKGEIRVESEFGKGTTFHVALPREISTSHDA